MTPEELRAIDAMLKRAGERGLEAEVVHALCRSIKAGNKLEDAIACALGAWDL